jgi:hypothetical protein
VSEALRQQAVLQALAGPASDAARAPSLGLQESGTRAAAGWQAYRVNRDAAAARALQAAFATVHELVGAEDFARLARDHWLWRAPSRGDLGAWGEDFAGWLQDHPALAAWPWLGDCARLDWAVHGCERAADASADLNSLALLDGTEPNRLWIDLMPGCAVLGSDWPIASIHDAHRVAADAAGAAFEDVARRIAAQHAEHVLVARAGWRGVVYRLDAPSARFTGHVLDGMDLGGAVEAAQAGFVFADWLAAAVRHGWVKGVRGAAD